jgi:uncharacterized membrane protein YhiD involved in acid resistance
LEDILSSLRKYQVAALAIFSLVFLLVPLSSAQQRLSDKDVESTMKNLREDSKRFQSSFNSSISKSTIRKTSQEKDAKALVKTFQSQTETMLHVFQDKKKADATLPGALGTAKQIDGVLSSVSLGGTTVSDWAKCKAELNILANEFNMPPLTN